MSLVVGAFVWRIVRGVRPANVAVVNQSGDQRRGEGWPGGFPFAHASYR